MLAIHVGPTDVATWAGQLYTLPHGRASILFGLVAGVGVALMAASRTASAADARLKLAWRALLLLPLGLALQELDHSVYVILQDYSLLFLVGMAVLTLPGRWLLAAAGLVAVVGPLGFLAGEVLAPDTFNRQAVAWSDPVGQTVHGLVLSGPYPLITWAAPFMFGLWVGRRDLRALNVRIALTAGGAGVAVLAAVTSAVLVGTFGAPAVGEWQRVIVDEPHSQMPLWVIGSTGSAAFVLGLSLFAADAARRLTWPLVAAGQLALTVYVGHLLALHWWRTALTSDDVAGASLLVLAFVAAAAAFSTAWRAAFSRGPLEAALVLPWQAARRIGDGSAG